MTLELAVTVILRRLYHQAKCLEVDDHMGRERAVAEACRALVALIARREGATLPYG